MHPIPGCPVSTTPLVFPLSFWQRSIKRWYMSVRTLLEQQESDLAAVQTALRDLESEKRKLGESHTTDRFSLELELDRLKRDLARCEDELARARDDLREKERVRHDRDGAMMGKAHQHWSIFAIHCHCSSPI
jgi:septal ring factor EnvC (AmiA/AmiB activator)